MHRSRWRLASAVLLVAVGAGCSSFSSVDDPPPAGDPDAGPSDAAAALDVALDSPTPGDDDAPSPPAAYPIVFHFDAGSGECGLWTRYHGATFTPIEDGMNGAGCRICQDAAAGAGDTNPPFLKLLLSPTQIGTYKITGFFRSGTSSPKVPSSLNVGFQVSTTKDPSFSVAPSIAPTVSTTTATWAIGEVPVVMPTVADPQGIGLLIGATIEMDPEGSPVTDDCFDVDEITIEFTPSK